MTVQLANKEVRLSTISGMVNINDISIGAPTCLTNKFQVRIAEMKRDVLTGNLNYDVKVEKNKKDIEKIRSILSKLPKVLDFVKVKPVIPEFEEIEALKSDSQEIKKFIRKANYDFIGYHCNHKMFDKQYEKLDSEVAKLFESEDYKKYDELIESFATTLYHITESDKYGESVSTNEIMELESDAKKINGCSG